MVCHLTLLIHCNNDICQDSAGIDTEILSDHNKNNPTPTPTPGGDIFYNLNTFCFAKSLFLY